MLNRIAEQLYRQLIAWGYQLKGYNVLFDRHFLFDGAIDEVRSRKSEYRFTTRFHHWMLTKVLPKPGLTLFLYAPAEVLFERKGEANLKYLESKNQSFKNIGGTLKRFKTIDATQSIDKVFECIKTEIINFCNHK